MTNINLNSPFTEEENNQGITANELWFFHQKLSLQEKNEEALIEGLDDILYRSARDMGAEDEDLFTIIRDELKIYFLSCQVRQISEEQMPSTLVGIIRLLEDCKQGIINETYVVENTIGYLNDHKPLVVEQALKARVDYPKGARQMIGE